MGAEAETWKQAKKFSAAFAVADPDLDDAYLPPLIDEVKPDAIDANSNESHKLLL